MHSIIIDLLHSFLIILSSLVILNLAYPNCNAALYGTPPYDDCKNIFFDSSGNRGLESLDKKNHFFGAVGNPSRRPPDITRKGWDRRVDLPRRWHEREPLSHMQTR